MFANVECSNELLFFCQVAGSLTPNYMLESVTHLCMFWKLIITCSNVKMVYLRFYCTLQVYQKKTININW